MQFRCTSLADWPPLAWLARCVRGDAAIDVFHGARVETGPDWFGEAVWAGSYDAADFDRTDLVFGSGARIRDDRAIFVSSGTTVDRLQSLEVPGALWISNSLACLLAATGATVDPLYPRYFEHFGSIRRGVRRYRRTLPTSRGTAQLTYYDNLEWDGVRLRAVDKPAPVRDFSSFAQYRAFLAGCLGAMAENMAARGRTHPYQFLGTLSTGYDSPTVAVLAREAGLRAVITVDRARDGAYDGGQELAARLGLTPHVVRREAWRTIPLAEVPFIAADAKGEDVYFKGAEPLLAGRVLLTGFHGDRAWSPRPRPLDTEIVRQDRSGLSLSEYRLWVGFIHAPVPFLGIRQLPDISAVSRSPEMRPWDWPVDRSRPICRRIVEQAGLPRHLFGIEKKAASVLLFDEGFLGPASLAEYTAWLAEHTGDPRGPRLPPREALVRRAARGLAPLVRWIPRRWPTLRAVADRVARLGRREERFRYVFPWALAAAQRRYPLGARSGSERAAVPAG